MIEEKPATGLPTHPADQTPLVDLPRYCARIGYDGPLEPTLAVLRALHVRHPAAICFEAIDALLGRGVDLAPAAIDAKLIGAGRGGYCYEQNGLFLRVLRQIGFSAEGLLARVNWMAPPGAPLRPLTHMALKVTIDGTPWLADVGFGGCVPTAPLQLDTDAPQQSPHELFRLRMVDRDHQLEVLLGDQWQTMYRTDGRPQHAIDYELPNWYTATHPSSQFRHRLIVSRVTPEARLALAGARLTVRTPDGASERMMLDAAGIERALRDRFGLPVTPDWAAMIAHAAQDQGETWVPSPEAGR